MKTPISYYGGKQTMLKHILPLTRVGAGRKRGTVTRSTIAMRLRVDLLDKLRLEPSAARLVERLLDDHYNNGAQ